MPQVLTTPMLEILVNGDGYAENVISRRIKIRTINEILDGEKDFQEFLKKCKYDFKFFCERVLGLTEYGGVQPYMMEWFNLIEEHDKVIIRAPSGFAKTTVLGVAYPLWKVFTKTNLRILLVSKTIAQSKDALLYQIKDYIEDNELLKELIPKDMERTWNQTQLKTSNGCTIVNRPYAISIKGYRADIIICDEIDSYEDPEIYFDHVISRLNPGGKIIGITTPEGANRLVAIIEIRDMNKGEYIIKTYPAIVDCKISGDLTTGKSIWKERFNIDELMKRRTMMGEQKFQKNYMCNLMVEEEDTIFKSIKVSGCKDYSLGFTEELYGEEPEVYIGCDFAIASGPTSDYDVYVVVEKYENKAIIKHAEVKRGLPPEEKIKLITRLYNIYKPYMIICDESLIGSVLIRQLRDNGLPVEAQDFHPRSRNNLLGHLKVLVDNKMIIIPSDPNDERAVTFATTLEYELISFREVKSLSTNITKYLSKASHDDTVMALAMAVKNIKPQPNTDVEDYIAVA